MHDYTQLTLDTFEKFIDAKFEQSVAFDVITNSVSGYCPDCCIPMVRDSVNYQCGECGLTLDNESERVSHDETYTSNVRITTGANKESLEETNRSLRCDADRSRCTGHSSIASRT